MEEQAEAPAGNAGGRFWPSKNYVFWRGICCGRDILAGLTLQTCKQGVNNGVHAAVLTDPMVLPAQCSCANRRGDSHRYFFDRLTKRKQSSGETPEAQLACRLKTVRTSCNGRPCPRANENRRSSCRTKQKQQKAPALGAFYIKMVPGRGVEPLLPP